MKSVSEIKHAIRRLSEKERRQLSRWIIEDENKAWDKEISDDAAAGRLQFLVDEAKDARKTGKLRKFP